MEIFDHATVSFPVTVSATAWQKFFSEQHTSPVISHVKSDVPYIITGVFSNTCSSDILSGWSSHGGWLFMTIPGSASQEAVTIETTIDHDLTRFELRASCSSGTGSVILHSYIITEDCGGTSKFQSIYLLQKNLYPKVVDFFFRRAS